MERSKKLIYGLSGHPSIRETIFAALRHLLVIFIAIITPSLIINSALKFDLDTTGFLVSVSLFVSGLAIFIQCCRFSPVGAGLLCIQGTSFSFISPIIGAGMSGIISGRISIEMGLNYIFDVCLVASVVEMVVSRLLPYTRRIITLLVSGIAVSLIGMCLIKAGINSCGDGQSAVGAGTFGSMQNLGLALLVLASVIFFNRSSNCFLRIGSIALGLLIGCVVAYALNVTDFSSPKGSGSLNIPIPFKCELNFDLSTVIGTELIHLVAAVEALDGITAGSLVSGEPVEGPVFLKRAQGGILTDGFNSLLVAVFGGFPNSIFVQNNGMIRSTGVANRYVGYFITGALVLLRLFPVVGKVFSLILDPILGGAALLIFGTAAAVGVRIITPTEITRKAVLVMAISFAMGLSVELVPGILGKIPGIIKSIFSSGITIDDLTAILANAFIRTKE